MIDHRIFLRFMCMVRHNGVGGGAASCLAAEGSGVLGEGDEERGDGGGFDYAIVVVEEPPVCKNARGQPQPHHPSHGHSHHPQRVRLHQARGGDHLRAALGGGAPAVPDGHARCHLAAGHRGRTRHCRCPLRQI